MTHWRRPQAKFTNMPLAIALSLALWVAIGVTIWKPYAMAMALATLGAVIVVIVFSCAIVLGYFLFQLRRFDP